MAYDGKRFRERYQRAEQNRQDIASIINDAYEMCLPLRPRMYMQEQRRPNVDRLFDGTASDALLRFASSTLDDIWPLEQKPFDLELGARAKVQDPESARRMLSGMADDVVTAINNSRFRTAAFEAMQDYGISTGIMLIEPGDASEPYRFRALPLAGCVLDSGPFGGIEALFRCLEMPVSHVQATYPRARLPKAWLELLRSSPLAKVKVVEGYERDRTGPPGEEVWCFVLMPEKAADGDEPMDTQEWKGEGSCPFIAFSYSRIAGETYGRGPAMAALPDIRTANKLKEMLLEHADLALSGIWVADDDGVINVDTAVIEPGTIIPRSPGSKGLEAVQLPPGPNFGYVELERLQQSIRRFFHQNDLGPLDQTPRSAREVMQRSSDNARALAGPYGNLVQDFLFPLIRRVVWIAKHHGGVTSLPRLDGNQIKIRPLAPLTRQMAQDNILRHTGFMEIVGQFFGPQAISLFVDGDKFVPWLADESGFNPALLRSDAAKADLVKQIASVAQQTGALPPPPGSAPPQGAPA